MQHEDVRKKIQTFILERFPQARAAAVDVNEPLLVNGILDSLGVLDVVTFIEQDFGVTIDDEELTPEHFHSIHTIADFVVSKVGSTCS